MNLDNNKLEIVAFSTDPADGDTLVFSIYPNFPYTDEVLTFSFTAVTTVTDVNQIEINPTQSIFAQNIYDAFTVSEPNVFTYFEVTDQAGLSVRMQTKNGSPVFDELSSSPTMLLLNSTEYSYPEWGEIPTRSPYIVTTPVLDGLTDARWTIKTWRGSAFDAPTAAVSHIIEKSKLHTSQGIIWFDISPLLREDFGGGYNPYNQYSATFIEYLNENETLWVEIYAEYFSLGETIGTGQTFYFATDGYLKPTEDVTYTIPRVGIYGTERILPRGSRHKLTFNTDDLLNVWYELPNGDLVNELDWNVDLSLPNKGYYQSVNVDTSLNVDYLTYYLTYKNPAYTGVVRYNLVEACKYTNYDVVFKNKQGFLETISMYKKSSKRIATTGKEFKRNLSDIDGVYTYGKHSTVKYNTTGNEEWTLNTDYLPDYMNEIFKQFMLSQEVFIIIDDVMTPVVKLDESLDFKTELNDKLFSYTVRVRLDYEEVKNLR